MNAQRCADDMAEFTEKIEAYVSCLRSSIRDAEERQRSLEEIFECKREGGDDCGDGQE